MDKESFLRVIKEVVERSKNEFKVCYMYIVSGKGYGASFRYWKDWLFKAYPGGRTMLSRKGTELARELGINV
jgi:hypothetical protein